jgi:hypothetical protein
VAGAVIVKFFDANAGVAAESCAPTAYVPGLTDVGKVTLRLLNAPVLSVLAVASAVPEQGTALQAQKMETDWFAVNPVPEATVDDPGPPLVALRLRPGVSVN